MRLVASDISCSVENRMILKPMDFSIETGEFVAILGLNGVGKSTLLNILLGDTIPSKGKIYLQESSGEILSAKEIPKRRAVLLQESYIPFPLSVLELVEMSRYPHRNEFSEKENREIALYCLEEVGMLAFRDRIYQSLSGGEKQRVLFAKTIAQIYNHSVEKPCMLFLDEPASSMDIKQEYFLMNYLKKLSKKGIGVLIILHDWNLAFSYADRILVLQNGAVYANASPKEVLEKNVLEDVLGISKEDISIYFPNLAKWKLSKV